MNGRISKIIRRKAFQLYMKKQRVVPLKRIVRRMKKLYKAGI